MPRDLTNDAWLGVAKWDDAPAPDAMTVATVGLRGALRGVTEISYGRLSRALQCRVTPVAHAPGAYLVQDPLGRNTREGNAAGQYVHLLDRDVTRCHCEDFLTAGGARKEPPGEEVGRPCKHILAACLHDPLHRDQLAPFLEELTRRAKIAAAVSPAHSQPDAA